MGWRVTVKAGKVRDMKNKRRKTGRKTGKMRRWSGGANPIPQDLIQEGRTLKQYLDLFKDENYGFKSISNVFLRKTKCVTIPNGNSDIIVIYDHSLRREPRIFRDQLLSTLPKESSSPVYYTYIFDINGMAFGRIYDSLEMGSGHQMLVQNERDLVYIAGEIEILNNNIRFNFESGSYSRELNIVHHILQDPVIQQNLINLVTAIFKLSDQNGTVDTSLNITYTPHILFPTKNPTQEEIKSICHKTAGDNRLFISTDSTQNKCDIMPRDTTLLTPLCPKIDTNAFLLDVQQNPNFNITHEQASAYITQNPTEYIFKKCGERCKQKNPNGVFLYVYMKNSNVRQQIYTKDSITPELMQSFYKKHPNKYPDMSPVAVSNNLRPPLTESAAAGTPPTTPAVAQPAAAANPAQPAATVAAAAATESSVPAGTHTLVMHDGTTKQVHISTTVSANSSHLGVVEPQLHPSSPLEPTKKSNSDNNYVTDPSYLAYAAPKDATVSYSNPRYNFIFRLPVFLYPNTQNPKEYFVFSNELLNGTKNTYILRPCSDQKMSHFIITYTNDNGEFKHTKILIVDNQYLKIEDQWNPVDPNSTILKPKPKHYDDLFPDLSGILKLFFHKDITPLKIYTEPYDAAQSLYLGLTPPQSFPPSKPISPAEAEAIRLHEVSQRGPDSTQPLEEDIGVAQPAAAATTAIPAIPTNSTNSANPVVDDGKEDPVVDIRTVSTVAAKAPVPSLAAATNQVSCANLPVIIHMGLDQNHTKIVNKLNESFRIARNDSDGPFVGNACLYYAINNLVNNFPEKDNTQSIINLLNDLHNMHVINKDIPTYWNVILDTPDKSIFEGIFKKYKNIVFATYKSFLNTNTFESIKCTQIISRRQVNPNSATETYEWTPLTSLQGHILSIDPDNIPWINGELLIIALVQTSKETQHEAVSLEYDTPGHLIAIKIKADSIIIADSIHIHDNIFERYPIDRTQDPKVKQIIADLCAIRPDNGTTTFGQQILYENIQHASRPVSPATSSPTFPVAEIPPVADNPISTASASTVNTMVRTTAPVVNTTAVPDKALVHDMPTTIVIPPTTAVTDPTTAVTASVSPTTVVTDPTTAVTDPITPTITPTTAPTPPTAPTPTTASVALSTATTALVAPTTVATAPNKTLTIAPTGTISEPHHISVAAIENTTYDHITKIKKTTFKNGTVVTTKKSNTNPQVFECTISSQT